MNARRKCKQLKKELEQYKNFKTGGIISTFSSVPIEHYGCVCRMGREDVEFFKEDIDKIAKLKILDEFCHFFENKLLIEKTMDIDGSMIFKTDLYIGGVDHGSNS